MSLNSVILSGNLGSDPETVNQDIPIVRLRVAVGRRIKKSDGSWETKTDWFNVKTFRNEAVRCSKYLVKGSGIEVIGHLETSSWTDAQGNKKYATEIIADRIEFGKKPASSNVGHRLSKADAGSSHESFVEDELSSTE